MPVASCVERAHRFESKHDRARKFTLSASLLFLAGSIHLARMRTGPGQLAAACVALVSFLVAAGVRPEKRVVLIVALLLTGLVWFACRHRHGLLPEPRVWQRAGTSRRRSSISA